MTKLILTAIVTCVGFAFWMWKRYGSKSAEIARKEKRIRKILDEQQDALENNDTILFNMLDRERLRLCQEVNDLH